MIADLRYGRWQESLKGVLTADTLITDPPFSERVHNGHNAALPGGRKPLAFQPITEEDIAEFVAFWTNIVVGWICILTDHVSAQHWSEQFEKVGRYVFAPIPCVDKGSRVRLCGDGPSSWTTWLLVARPRTKKFSTWGTLPGAYVRDEKFERPVIPGGKPIWLMRKIVADYSRSGEIICDPFAGSGSTLIAASSLNRLSIGAEMDDETYREGVGRLLMSSVPTGDVISLVSQGACQ